MLDMYGHRFVRSSGVQHMLETELQEMHGSMDKEWNYLSQLQFRLQTQNSAKQIRD